MTRPLLRLRAASVHTSVRRRMYHGAIASTPWAKTVISKDDRKKLSALMIGRASPQLCKCRMVLILKFGTTKALSFG